MWVGIIVVVGIERRGCWDLPPTRVSGRVIQTRSVQINGSKAIKQSEILLLLLAFPTLSAFTPFAEIPVGCSDDFCFTGNNIQCATPFPISELRDRPVCTHDVTHSAFRTMSGLVTLFVSSPDTRSERRFDLQLPISQLKVFYPIDHIPRPDTFSPRKNFKSSLASP